MKPKPTVAELSKLFSLVFPDEGVAEMAATMTEHFPGMSSDNWLSTRDPDSHELVSALTYIPHDIRIGGIAVPTWEQGIVGTHPEHRGRGHVRELNRQLDELAAEQHIDLIIIQGIPGFYGRFGYRYAMELENQINLPLEKIAEKDAGNNPSAGSALRFREATSQDVAFLLSEQERQLPDYDIVNVRGAGHYEYLLQHAKETESECHIYIGEADSPTGLEPACYVRVHRHGFGEGLNVQEFSEHCSDGQLESLLVFLAGLAAERNKPYIRFDVCRRSDAAERLFARGARTSWYYGWQVKIPDPARFIARLLPVFERRLDGPSGVEAAGVLRLEWSAGPNTVAGRVELRLHAGSIVLHLPEGEESTEPKWVVAVPYDLFAPLLLGWRPWREMQQLRPDLFVNGPDSEALIDVLFPPLKCRVYPEL